MIKAIHYNYFWSVFSKKYGFHRTSVNRVFLNVSGELRFAHTLHDLIMDELWSRY
jgi:hypothetical protein